MKFFIDKDSPSAERKKSLNAFQKKVGLLCRMSDLTDYELLNLHLNEMLTLFYSLDLSLADVKSFLEVGMQKYQIFLEHEINS